MIIEKILIKPDWLFFKYILQNDAIITQKSGVHL